MASGICYTQSGGVKKYEPEELSISPDRIKIVDIDNHYGKPFIPYIFTSSSHPDGVSLEEGTAMYGVAVKEYDGQPENYLTYTPPDGYELVSEDHKYDTGVKEYYVSKHFYFEPFTVYYGTAGKTFSEYSISVGKYFYYKKKDSKVYVKLKVSNDIIINGNTYSPGENKPIMNTINTINLESGYGSVTKILVSLDSNHYTGSFDISFDGASPSNIKIYLLVNNNYYDVTTSSGGKRCHVSSKYQNGFHVVGYMYATNGFVYNFNAIDSVNNGLLFLSTQEGIKDSSGRYIPGGVKAKFVVKFTLNDGYYHQDCQLIVDVTSGNIKQ